MTKYDYKSLKNIDQKIEQIVVKLGLENYDPIKYALTSNQKFYCLISNYHSHKVIFKARLADQRVLRQSGRNFSNEINLLKTLHKYYPQNHLTKHIPLIYHSGQKNCQWILREFLEGRPLGTTDRSCDNLKKSDLEPILELLLDIQSFDTVHLKKHHPWAKSLKINTHDRYLASFDKFQRKRGSQSEAIFSPSLLKKARQIIQSKSDLLDSSSNILVHSDFHPANIFFHEGIAIAIDWETLRFGNAASDITTLWQRMSDYPNHRRQLLIQYASLNKQKNDFKTLFQVNALLSLLGETVDAFEICQSSQVNKEKNHAKYKLCYNNYTQALNGEKIENYE